MNGYETSARPFRVAVDIGGTFVDAVEFDERTKAVRLRKASTTPNQPSQGVLAATRGLGIPFETMESFVHGTTLGLNAILQRRGARTGIITNDGFRDIFEIARGDVPPAQMYDFQYQHPPRVVSRRCALGVGGRVNAEGAIVEDLDEAGVLRVGRTLVEDTGVQSIAITFLHSYLNPEHERLAAALLRNAYPNVSVSISSDIAREYREYERTSTTVLDAYIRPIFDQYIGSLESDLTAAGFDGSFLITRSAGGAMTSTIAKKSPLLTVLSGPAGGIIGASYVGSLVGVQNLISFDVGGTSLDACVILGGRPTEVYEAQIENFPLLIPIYDIRTIGAGGGSIAWIDAGLLKVGPRSAGADPGPISYGKGGTEPTVTDAAIVLGYLTAAEFLDGQLAIDEEAAQIGLRESIARPLALDVVDAAAGIFSVMLSRTVGAIREITVERGMDPREFSLLAFGGAGPMVAPMLIREMDIQQVIVPQAPAVFSAWGMLMSDLEFDFSRTILTVLTDTIVRALPQNFAEMEVAARELLAEQNVPEDDWVLEHRLDLRYSGQEHALPIMIDDLQSADAIRDRFDHAHFERYGHHLDAPIEVVTLRLRAIGHIEKPSIEPMVPASDSSEVAVIGQRQAYDFARRQMTTFHLYDRQRLAPGHEISGPALIIEGTCTVVMHGDQCLTVDPYGHLIIHRRQ